LEDVRKLAFGPVPSRRLGQSLGINNIPAKSCTYSCIYCQVGKTLANTTKRRPFYTPKAIFSEVKRKVNEGRLRNERADYLTFVSDGEPTLDVNLGREISLLKNIGIPIAVLTNASLMWCNDVKEDLLAADLVSLKVDAVSEGLWKEMNRPHENLRLDSILEGIRVFANDFRGILISETMLVDRMDYGNEFGTIADFLGHLKGLDKAYIAIPTRPPIEEWVRPAKEDMLNAAFQAFANKLGQSRVEYLTGYEGNAFAFTGEAEEDLLSITAVHPMRREAVEEFLKKSGVEWDLMKRLLNERKLVELDYEGKTFYMRRLHNR
jgi:wyosine [tRNA(Phe)-imidazoG37] synthetase (radical SAM superfamily)